MTMMYSTMGAPLSTLEEDAIHEAWHEVARIVRDISHDAPPLDAGRGETTVFHLNQVTELVIAISSFRTTVSNAWHYANKRAFPDPDRSVLGPLRRRHAALPSRAAALAHLNLSEADLATILSTMNPQESKP